MSGKCRPHLRKKTLENVKRSLLSQADKNCIAEVFDRFEKAQAEIDRLTEIEESHREQNGELRKEVELLNFENLQMLASIKGLKAETIKEFAERVYALFPCDKTFTTISRVAIRQIAKEMGVEL